MKSSIAREESFEDVLAFVQIFDQEQAGEVVHARLLLK
jgi:hypothetical protein